MTTDKGLSVRLHGKSKMHIQRAAKECGLVVNKFFQRPDGTFYGYGNTFSKFDPTPSNREKQNEQ
jgi:hypothetical protein